MNVHRLVVAGIVHADGHVVRHTPSVDPVKRLLKRPYRLALLRLDPLVRVRRVDRDLFRPVIRCRYVGCRHRLRAHAVRAHVQLRVPVDIDLERVLCQHRLREIVEIRPRYLCRDLIRLHGQCRGVGLDFARQRIHRFLAGHERYLLRSLSDLRLERGGVHRSPDAADHLFVQVPFADVPHHLRPQGAQRVVELLDGQRRGVHDLPIPNVAHPHPPSFFFRAQQRYTIPDAPGSDIAAFRLL